MWEMLLLAGLSGGAAPVPAVDATKPPLLSPKRLIEMYLQNEAFADERYSNKVIHVRGKVVRISRSTESSEEYCLYLDAEGSGSDADRPLDLLLFFNKKERKALAALNPGDAVTLQGHCLCRFVWGTPDKHGAKEYSQVHIRDCKLVPKEKPAPATPAPKEP